VVVANCVWIEPLDGLGVSWIGDAVSPRTVEEVVLEGLQLVWRI